MDYGLALAIATNLIVCGISYGVIVTRLSILERDAVKLEREIIDFRMIKEDMAVVKSQLTNIAMCITNLTREIHDRKSRKDEKDPS